MDIKLLVRAILSYFQQCNVSIHMLYLSISFFLLFYFVISNSKAKKINSLPSPPKLPLIGNLHQLGSLPHRTLQALSKKYGPIMLIHIGRVQTIIVSSSELACDIMKTHDLIFASRPKSSMAKLLMYDRDLAFAPYGEYWRQGRKIFAVNLLNIKMVQSFRYIREEEVELLINQIRRSKSDVINLSELIVALTNDIVCRVALGKKYREETGGVQKLRATLRNFGELLGSLPIGDFIPWLSWLDNLSGLSSRARKNSKELDEIFETILEEHIQRRRNAGINRKEDGDFVDLLLSVNEKDESDGIHLDRNSIKALILDAFAAGTDTTYTAIEWAMAELINNPKIMKKVQEEIKEIVGSKGSINDKDVERMIYLKAVIKETLRMHPPIPLLVPRETMQDIELKGYHIPKGTRVMINAWAIGRDPISWENSEEFSPDRFVNNNHVDFRGQNFEFIPFGAGRRICPGINFAIPTVELTLANLLHNFNWEMPESKVMDMSESSGIGVHKKFNLVVIAKPVAA